MQNPYWPALRDALHLDVTDVVERGKGDLPSAFAVSDFASASIGGAGAALAALQDTPQQTVEVDRRRASLWFDMTLRPVGWELPSVWDPIAGVYKSADGWVRLHTNAPHHRDVALRVLKCANERSAVADAVAVWESSALETAMVAAGGCAAALRSPAEWQAHPQGIAVRAEPLVHWHTVGSCRPQKLVGSPQQPLAGLRVLDLTRVLAGPVATRFLAGYGADVLRIDPHHWNEPAAEAEVTLGKRCAGLDLQDREDRKIFEDLLASSDVFVHGYRPGALEGLGYGASARRLFNPTLIDVSLSAYGRAGPWAGRRGFDSLVQMSCGIAAEGQRLAGQDGPLPLPVQALDHGTGYLMAAAVLRGLAQRAEGHVLRAELSLARTADLLMTHRGSLSPDVPIIAEPDDFSETTEATSWGNAHRVKPPLTVLGEAPTWSLPAGHLRRHPATW